MNVLEEFAKTNPTEAALFKRAQELAHEQADLPVSDAIMILMYAIWSLAIEDFEKKLKEQALELGLTRILVETPRRVLYPKIIGQVDEMIRSLSKRAGLAWVVIEGMQK